MAKTKIADKAIAEDLSGVTLSFSDEQNMTVNLSDLPPEIVTHLALHGLSQKLGDAYSGEKDVAVARGKAEAVAKRLVNGDWKAVREGGGGRITDLAHALATVTGRTIEEAVGVIEGMTKEAKKDLRNHAQIKAELARITAERAAEAAERAKADAESGPSVADLIG